MNKKILNDLSDAELKELMDYINYILTQRASDAKYKLQENEFQKKACCG